MKGARLHRTNCTHGIRWNAVYNRYGANVIEFILAVLAFVGVCLIDSLD